MSRYAHILMYLFDVNELLFKFYDHRFFKNYDLRISFWLLPWKKHPLNPKGPVFVVKIKKSRPKFKSM